MNTKKNSRIVPLVLYGISVILFFISSFLCFSQARRVFDYFSDMVGTLPFGALTNYIIKNGASLLSCALYLSIIALLAGFFLRPRLLRIATWSFALLSVVIYLFKTELMLNVLLEMIRKR